MKFKLDDYYITCIPDNIKEINNIKDSFGNDIQLNTHILHFNNLSNNITNASNLSNKITNTFKVPHPDILALICLIAFYPFLKNAEEIIFPQDVSSIWLKILNDHKLTTKTNINGNQKPYAGNFNNIGLSWGGGVDTWGVYQLQKEIYKVLVHEYQEFSPLPLRKKDYPNIVIIETNLRKLIGYVNKPDDVIGWFIWSAVLITSLWVSNEYSLSLLTVGGNMGSTFLQDGKKYHPTHLKPNLWFKTFEKLGLPIYVPLAGLTDLGVLKIINDTDKSVNMELVKYCWYSDKDGNNCHQCKKCIRKEILMGKQSIEKIDKTFNGPSFDYMKNLYSDLKMHKDLAKWIYKYYTPGLELIPKNREELRNNLLKKLKIYNIELLPKNLNYLVEHYGWQLS